MSPGLIASFEKQRILDTQFYDKKGEKLIECYYIDTEGYLRIKDDFKLNQLPDMRFVSFEEDPPERLGDVSERKKLFKEKRLRILNLQKVKKLTKNIEIIKEVHESDSSSVESSSHSSSESSSSDDSQIKS